jgi:hypothetical protein
MTDLKTYLEELIDLKRNCTIRFRADNDAISTLSTRIMDIIEPDGMARIRVEEGLEIGVDRILSVDGHYFGGLS